MKSDHNHSILPSAFQHRHKQQKLPEDAYQNVQTMISLGANPSKIKEHLTSLTGNYFLLINYQKIKLKKFLDRVVTTKDVQNIKSNMRSPNKNDSVFENVKKTLENFPGATINFGYSEKNLITHIFFQTPFMKKMFEKYNEVLILNAAYKLSYYYLILISYLKGVFI